MVNMACSQILGASPKHLEKDGMSDNRFKHDVYDFLNKRKK